MTKVICEYLLSTYYMPVSALGARDTTVERNKVFALLGLKTLVFKEYKGKVASSYNRNFAIVIISVSCGLAYDHP